MQQRLRRAERYRKEANRYAELAKTTTDPNFLIKLYRQTAVRYVPRTWRESPSRDMTGMVSPSRLGIAPTYSYEHHSCSTAKRGMRGSREMKKQRDYWAKDRI
jgi:hypothetical protein